MKTLILTSIMCPSFCIDEPPPLNVICDTSRSDAGRDGFPILPIPLAQFDHSGGVDVPPIHPFPENPPTTVVPEPSSIVIMGLVGIIGLLTMRKRVCPVD